MDAGVAQLVGIIDRAYDAASWHGVNLKGSVRGLSPAAASRRPAPGRHNIWEIVVHCAYWKYAAWRRLTGARRGSFPLDGSNWFERPPSRSRAAWQADRRLLERMHRELREAVRKADRRVLHRRLPGSKVTRFDLIAGIAAHDLYHAGQIQFLKRLGG
ncbi:MAG TPA: DinB family protein [Vicinamibacterales bacterium]|nr:DinB family protein [Vicinamibacterales bacterium]